MDTASIPYSPSNLLSRLGCGNAPLVIDVRRGERFAARLPRSGYEYFGVRPYEKFIASD